MIKLKILLLESSRYEFGLGDGWWVEPNGNMIMIGDTHHGNWAADHMKQYFPNVKNVKQMSPYQIFDEYLKNGWLRVTFNGSQLGIDADKVMSKITFIKNVLIKYLEKHKQDIENIVISDLQNGNYHNESYRFTRELFMKRGMDLYKIITKLRKDYYDD